MHNIQYYDFKENVDKRKAENEINDFVSHETWEEGGGGLYKGIRWLNYVADDYDSAIEYIESHDRGDYDNLAVKYRTTTKPKTKAYEKLLEKHRELANKINELEGKVHFKDCKSALIGCKECGSKIAREYLRSNKCPVCGHDLRPATVLNNIEKLKKQYKENGAKIKEVEKKASTKAPLKWVVKFEYHT